MHIFSNLLYIYNSLFFKFILMEWDVWCSHSHNLSFKELEGWQHRIWDCCLTDWTQDNFYVWPLWHSASRIKIDSFNIILPQMLDYIDDEVQPNSQSYTQQNREIWKEDRYGCLNVSATNKWNKAVQQSYSQPIANQTEIGHKSIKFSRSIFPFNYKYKKLKQPVRKNKVVKQRLPAPNIKSSWSLSSNKDADSSNSSCSDNEWDDKIEISFSSLQFFEQTNPLLFLWIKHK